MNNKPVKIIKNNRNNSREFNTVSENKGQNKKKPKQKDNDNKE